MQIFFLVFAIIGSGFALECPTCSGASCNKNTTNIPSEECKVPDDSVTEWGCLHLVYTNKDKSENERRECAVFHSKNDPCKKNRNVLHDELKECKITSRSRIPSSLLGDGANTTTSASTTTTPASTTTTPASTTTTSASTTTTPASTTTTPASTTTTSASTTTTPASTTTTPASTTTTPASTTTTPASTTTTPVSTTPENTTTTPVSTTPTDGAEMNRSSTTFIFLISLMYITFRIYADKIF